MKKIIIIGLVFLLTGLACLAGYITLVAEKEGALPGNYRAIWSDGTANDHVFTISYANNEWLMSAAGEESFLMYKLDQEDLEQLVDDFENKTLLSAQCVDSGGASRIIVCATEPGTKLFWRGEEKTIETGYFVYMGFEAVYMLEKLQ